jgi:hypothetical protein
MIGDHTKINNMTESQLRDFALFAYTAYPTLLETHEHRIAFAQQYPDKVAHRSTEGPHQMEFHFTQEVDKGE